ncbi:hypothetical protein [Aquisalinus flavus]|uniref:Uncharacterized protein n=1 Tax=Aquisalinus flavus TaxID=1526572 RepID=A0A8J2V4F4_9PROT|nr:hypothetical protein [Aquisalinus flavus]MBD0426730.1 hypothetical protein [Aquisalinus flavus]UNE46591.1 hypothetical protein FF099_00200 [Aquisalinus flavus]GGC95534.1 hypothetical protein GCM10011342_00400 [Aquisalinus flavus]
MSEAEVAQQLIADLQANIGVISISIIVLLLAGLLALGTTLSNASRAMRELRDGVSRQGNAGRGMQMSYGAQQADPHRSSHRLARTYATPPRPIGRDLPLARKSSPRHQARAFAGPETAQRRPRRRGDRHSLI